MLVRKWKIPGIFQAGEKYEKGQKSYSWIPSRLLATGF
jgi:hypothetical protein